MKNLKKRKLEEITKEISQTNKESNKPIQKISKLDEGLKELNKKESSSEEPKHKKIKLLFDKKTEEKETKKGIDKTTSAPIDELGEKISRKEHKKIKKEKQKAKKNLSTTSSDTKQELLNSVSKSTDNSLTTDNQQESSTHNKKDVKSHKSSKHSKNNKILDKIISNTYSGNGYSNPILKVDHSHKSNWAVSDIDNDAHEEASSLKPKKSALSKIGNWIVEEKKEDDTYNDEVIHNNDDDDEYVVKNQVKENYSERADSAPVVTWDEKLESKQEKLDRVIARESAHIEKSGEFEVDKSNTLYGSNGKYN